jgi:hypothetical protein
MSEPVFGMSNLSDKRTGLDNIVIWVSDGEGVRHAPRIKVSNIRGKSPESKTNSFSVSIGSHPEIVAGTPKGFSPRELRQIFSWVTLNTITLLEYWNFQLSTEEMQEALVKC